MAKFRPKETWGVVSCDDGHYFICTGRTAITSTISSASVVGTAMRKDTAILMAAAPDMYELLKEFWEKDRGIYIHSLNPERNKRYRLVRSILDRIDGKEHKNDA